MALELLKVDVLEGNIQDMGGRTALMKCWYGHADIALEMLRDPL